MISVIIPAHNAESVIAQCLASVLEQSFADIECIVVDDASTDETLQMVRRMSATDGRLRVLANSEKCGPSASRNRGLAVAEGKYVTFVDADDWLSENALAALHAFAEQHALEYCFASHDEYVERDAAIRQKNIRIDESRVLTEDELFGYVDLYIQDPCRYFGLVHCWARLFKREVITAQGLTFDSSLTQMEDVAFNFNFLKHCQRVGAINQPLYTHRIPVSGNLGSMKGAEPDFEVKLLRAIGPLRSFARERMQWDEEKLRQRLDHFYSSMVIVSLIRMARSFFVHPTKNRYARIRALIAATTTQAAIARYRPGKHESRFIGLAIRQRSTTGALAVCFLKRAMHLTL